MNRHHFSALDRHAVLSGSDDGFPWYAGTMLAVEASEVVCLRLEKIRAWRRRLRARSASDGD
jgi:hypothetical protein